jgi:hypothetical protein
MMEFASYAAHQRQDPRSGFGTSVIDVMGADWRRAGTVTGQRQALRRVAQERFPINHNLLKNSSLAMSILFLFQVH